MNTCTGVCCAQFPIGHSTMEHLRSLASGAPIDSQIHQIVDMVIVVVPNGNVVKGEVTGDIFTCRHWDRDTKLCRIYEQRPKMCSEYPYLGMCRFCGMMYNTSSADECDW